MDSTHNRAMPGTACGFKQWLLKYYLIFECKGCTFAQTLQALAMLADDPSAGSFAPSSCPRSLCTMPWHHEGPSCSLLPAQQLRLFLGVSFFPPRLLRVVPISVSFLCPCPLHVPYTPGFPGYLPSPRMHLLDAVLSIFPFQLSLLPQAPCSTSQAACSLSSHTPMNLHSVAWGCLSAVPSPHLLSELHALLWGGAAPRAHCTSHCLSRGRANGATIQV